MVFKKKPVAAKQYEGIDNSSFIGGGTMLKMEDFTNAVRGIKPLPTEEYGTLTELLTGPVEICGLSGRYRFAGLHSSDNAYAYFVDTSESSNVRYPFMGGLRVPGKQPKVEAKPKFSRGECVKPKGTGNIYSDVGFEGMGIANSLNSKFRGYVRNPVPDAKGRIQVYAVCYIEPGDLESTGTFKQKGEDPK